MGSAVDLPRLSELRGAPPRILGVTRLVKSLVAAKGDLMQAAIAAETRHRDTPNVALALKVAVTSGSTASGSVWGSQLSSASRMLAEEFIASIRTRTVIDRLLGARRVPMHIQIPRSTQASSAAWVQEGYPVPMSEMALDTATLGVAKLGGIVAFSQELARSSNPSAEAVIQGDLLASVVAFCDTAFLSPSYVAVTDKNPASITANVTPVTSTGITALAISNDLRSAVAAILNGGGQLQSPVWITTPRIKFALAMLRDSSNNTAFPEVGLNGTIGGAPILTSTSVPSSTSGGGLIILLDAAELLIADEGSIEVDVSNQASLQMDSAPSAGAQSLISMWQSNLTAIKVMRWLNWAPRRSAAAVCAWIDGVAL